MTWIIASLLFSWYTAHFGSYNKTYGSLGAAVGFMTWIWISTMVILAGAKINAEVEHQTGDRHHDWNSGASRQARRSNGRYSWAKLFIG